MRKFQFPKLDELERAGVSFVQEKKMEVIKQRQ